MIMMSWFFIVLIAVFLWSLVNISDQYLVAKYSTGERSSAGLALFGSFIGIVTTLIIGISVAGIFLIPMLDKLLLMIVGSITLAWVVLYLFTLEISDVSAVVPWFLTIPVFGYFLGYVFLGETISFQQGVGSFIVLLGGFFMVADFSDKKMKFLWKPAFYMSSGCFLSALAGAIFKYVTIGNSFWIASFWQYAGFSLSGILIFILVPKYRNEFMRMLQQGGKKIFAISMMTETLTITGNLLTNFALLLAPIGMVYLLQSFQPAMVLCLTLAGTWFFPSIVKENLSKKALIPKLIALGIMIIGSGILFL